MSENLTVYVHDDRFATMSTEGVVRIWQVNNYGVPQHVGGAGYLEPIDLNEEDLIVTALHIEGQPVNQGPRGIKITHAPTGLVATSVADISQLENKVVALRELDRRVKERAGR